MRSVSTRRTSSPSDAAGEGSGVGVADVEGWRGFGVKRRPRVGNERDSEYWAGCGKGVGVGVGAVRRPD